MTARKPKAPPRPAVGQRVHFDSGHDSTSWSAIVRAIVDDKVMVLKEWWPTKQSWRYRTETLWWWDMGHVKAGPLPRRKKSAKKASDE